MTFIQVDIAVKQDHCDCYIHNRDLNFQGQTFSCYALVIKMRKQRIAHGRFSSTRTAPRLEGVVLVLYSLVSSFVKAIIKSEVKHQLLANKS